MCADLGRATYWNLWASLRRDLVARREEEQVLGWMLLLPEAELLLAELVLRCGRWGAVWDWEQLLPKDTCTGPGNPGWGI